MTAPQQLINPPAPALPVRPSGLGNDLQEFCGIRVHYGRGGGLVNPPRRRSEAIFVPRDLVNIGRNIGATLVSHWALIRPGFPAGGGRHG